MWRRNKEAFSLSFPSPMWWNILFKFGHYHDCWLSGSLCLGHLQPWYWHFFSTADYVGKKYLFYGKFQQPAPSGVEKLFKCTLCFLKTVRFMITYKLRTLCIVVSCCFRPGPCSCVLLPEGSQFSSCCPRSRTCKYMYIFKGVSFCAGLSI